MKSYFVQKLTETLDYMQKINFLQPLQANLKCGY